MEQSEIPQDPHHLEVPSGVSKTISEPLVHSAQTMHLSCIKISCISKQTKTSLHLSLVTYEYHLVRLAYGMFSANQAIILLQD
jgi:hypothetical protein